MLEKKKLNDLVFIILILIFTLILLYLIIKFNHQEELCSQNPLVYGVRKLGEVNNADLMCTCVFEQDNPLVQRPILKINKDEMIIESIYGGIKIK